MRGGSCPSGKPNNLAAHGKDRSPYPVQQSLHTSTTPTTWGRKRLSPGSKPPRTVWKLQPRRPITDWLGLENKASATGGRQDPIPGSEIPPYIYNSDNAGTKTVIPGSTPPCTVWKPQLHRPIADWLGIEKKASAIREREGLIPGSDTIPYLHNFDNLGTRTMIVRVETAPHGVETPTPPADR